MGESFLLAMDFLRADRVGSKGGSAGATLLLTTGVSGGLCSFGVIFGSLKEDSSREETISSISGGDCLEDLLCLRGFWVLSMAIRKDFLVGLAEGFGLVDLGYEREDEALACIALNWRTRGRSIRPARV